MVARSYGRLGGAVLELGEYVGADGQSGQRICDYEETIVSVTFSGGLMLK
jgi:hypothetical protein